MTILEQAWKFVSSGIGVLPIQYRDKRPDFKLIQTWEPLKTELPDYNTLQRWFSSGQHNYGVIAGWQGLVVIDFDDMPTYRAWMRWIERSHSACLRAYQVATGRGAHLYVRLPHKERNRKIGKIDIKADGYVLGPGSIHPSGAIYRAMREVYHFPKIRALSDVLPMEWLVQAPAPANVAAAQNVAMPAAASPSQAPSGGLVDKVKKSFAIESFFPDARPSRGMRWMLARCPLHDDHSPSMWIDTRDQVCGCFAGCTEKPLDVINLVGRINGLNNRDTIFYLAERM